MEKKYKIICAECGTIFYSDNPDKKYCLPACGHIAQYKQLENYRVKHKIRGEKEREPKYITLKNGMEVRNDILGKIMNSPEVVTIKNRE